MAGAGARLSGKSSPRTRTRTRMIQGADAGPGTGTGTGHVAFSKRLFVIFKTVRELCALCVVETAIVLFSPAAVAGGGGGTIGKPFSFGHGHGHPIPGVVIVMMVNRLANCGSGRPNADAICELNEKKELEAEKFRYETVEQRIVRQLMGRPLNELSLEELRTLKSIIEERQLRVKKRLRELSLQSSPPASPAD